MCYRQMGVGEGYDKVWCIKMLERKFSCWLAYIINVSCYADPLPPTPSPPYSMVDLASHLSCIVLDEKYIIQGN